MLGLWVRKLVGKSMDVFSHMKDFMEEHSAERSGNQCMKGHLVNLQSRFC
jgi:hypothetical protein